MATLSPGQSWTGSGANGSPGYDVNLQVIVDGQVRMRLLAHNRRWDYPGVIAYYQGPSPSRNNHVSSRLEQDDTEELAGPGLHMWASRGNDSDSGTKNLVASILQVPALPYDSNKDKG